jgi:hypothetical protein
LSWSIVPSDHFTICREGAVSPLLSRGDDALVVYITILYSFDSVLAGMSDSSIGLSCICEFAERIVHFVLELDGLGSAREEDK